MNTTVCNECSTKLVGVTHCKEYFERMIAWDFSDFAGVGRVHHLTVLCYYLQHPSHYSQEGLQKAVHILKKVIEDKLSDKDLYKLESDTFSSSQRTWNVAATETNKGRYSHPQSWTMTVSAVVKDGISQYPEHVKKWSQTIFNDLKVVGNLLP